MIKNLLKKASLILGVGVVSSSVNAQTLTPPNDSCEYAMQFNGERESIQAFNDGFSKSDNFSIVGWFKTDTTEQGLMTLERDCCSDEYGFIDIDANGKLVFQYETSSSQEATVISSSNVNDDAWHHFAAVRNSSKDSVYLYVDGVLEERVRFTRDIFINPNLRLTLGVSDRTWNYFKGGMDEVSYWNKAISATEVQTIMNDELQGNESNLVAYYNFNEWREFGEVKDVTGNGHDLDFSDPSNFNRFLPQGVGCDFPIAPTPPNSDCGAIVNFDGDDDYIATNVAGSNFLDKDFTIETWVYIDSLKASGNVILSNLIDNEGFELRVSGSSNTDFRGRLSFLNLWSTTSLREKTWYHIAVAYDDASSNKLTLYINGFEEFVYGSVSNIRNSCSCRVPLGNLLLGYSADVDNADNQNFNGKMDELRIWSEERTQEQIFSMLDSSLTDSTENLVATFDFNDGNSATHIHSLTGKVTAEGELKNMNLDSAWSKVDGSPVQNTFHEIIAEDICGSYTSPNGSIYTESGTYIEVLSNNAGCDSTIRTSVNFASPLSDWLANVEVNDNTISASFNSSSRDYEWYNCDQPELGVLSTETTFSPSESGNYKLHVTQDGSCPAISECVEMIVTTTSTQDLVKLNNLNIYPNPTNGSLSIDLGESFQNVIVEVYSIAGVLVDNFNLGTATNEVIHINGNPGVYFVNIKAEGGLERTIKVIKK